MLANDGNSVQAARRYAFSAIGAAVVIVIVPFAVNMVSNVLYDALKSLVRSKKTPTVFQFRISEEDRTVEAHLETEDRVVLRDALSRFADAEAGSTIVEWDEEAKRWRPIR